MKHKRCTNVKCVFWKSSEVPINGYYGSCVIETESVFCPYGLVKLIGTLFISDEVPV